MQTHLEIETKYDVADGTQLPDLSGVDGVDAVVSRDPIVLSATYFDTAEHALAAAGATLRRRTGGTDDGWHLKLPLGDGERLEVHRPLGRSQTPPTALTSLVRSFVRQSALEAVATLVTNRTVHDLVDRDARVLAELADDTVNGERHGDDGGTVIWRELEIELVDGNRDLLGALDAAVRKAGVRPASSSSKVGRVLGAGLATSSPDQPPRVRRKTPVGEVLHAGLRELVSGLLSADPLVRVDRPESHARMRTAVQQLRAGLAIQRQVMPADDTDAIRAELSWLDTVIAEVEELDSAAVRIREALAVQPRDLVLGPVARRTERELAASRRAAVAALRTELDSARYLELLEAVAQLPRRAHGGPAADSRAGDVLPDLVDRALRRAERRLAQLHRAQSADERRWQLSGARRSVERARYAVRLQSGRPGSTRDRLALALDEAALVLGRVQASVRAQDVLRHLGVQAHLAGENGFTYGVLHGLEQSRADELVAEAKRFRKTLRRLDEL
jgi:inorganic triphosphatase YgiF